MKKSISILFTILLVLSCSLLLVACDGGISIQEDWDDAISYYQTCDAVTIKIYDNNLHMNRLHDKERLISTMEVSFDADKGIVFVNLDYTRRNFWEMDVGGSTYETYYVQDGANVYRYSKRISEYTTEDWEVDTISFNSDEETMLYLRDQYLHPKDFDGNEFPSILELNYVEFSKKAFGKFECVTSDNRFNYNYTVKFSNGKPTKYTYQHKAPGGNVDDKRKFSMTINYSADISLPDDLPNAN